jgi:hypothetical protein
MERFHQTSIKLQSTNMDLNEAVKLLRSLNNYVASLRDAFEDFEEKGKIKIGLENEPVYKEDTQRKKQRSVKLSRNDGNSEDTAFSGRDNFRVTVFLPMIDHLLTALQKRLEAYDAVSGKFGFLSKMPSVNGDQLRDAAERLVKTYTEDLNTSFPEEIVHFQEYMNDEPDVWLSQKGENNGTFIALRMLQTIVDNEMQDTFPNMYICLRIYLSLLVTNCSGERSFSALKRIKNYLRSTLKDEKLNHLALMHVESSVFRKLNFNNVLDQFVDRLTRKMFK